MLISLFKELEKKHQSNWQSILKHFEWCVNFAKEYLKKHGFSVDIQWKYEPNGESILKYFDIGSSNDYLKKWAIPVAYYKKWDITIDLESICNWIFSVCTQYYIVNEMVQAFPNWLRTQLIKMVYVNEQVSLQDENVEWLISKVDTSINENGVGKKPTRERIRDALSHHTSTQFNGIDEIVLRDWYDKKTDSWAREATFSLSQLFESTFRDLDENSIASSYSFLLEFLKNIDN